jgi:hypothetical protein
LRICGDAATIEGKIACCRSSRRLGYIEHRHLRRPMRQPHPGGSTDATSPSRNHSSPAPNNLGIPGTSASSLASRLETRGQATGRFPGAPSFRTRRDIYSDGPPYPFAPSGLGAASTWLRPAKIQAAVAGRGGHVDLACRRDGADNADRLCGIRPSRSHPLDYRCHPGPPNGGSSSR